MHSSQDCEVREARVSVHPFGGLGKCGFLRLNLQFGRSGTLGCLGGSGEPVTATEMPRSVDLACSKSSMPNWSLTSVRIIIFQFLEIIGGKTKAITLDTIRQHP